MLVGCARGGGDRLDGGGAGEGGMDAATRDAGGGVDAGCPMPCGEGRVCRLGRCLQQCGPDTPCTGGGTCCGDVCVNTENDQFNCGACNTMCPPLGNTCAGGACRCGTGDPCAAGETCCAGTCAALTTSTEHCGSCGVVCDTDAGETCVSGVCQLPECTPACAAGETCVDGECKCGGGDACGAGTGCCGGACINTDSDPNNCGGCGIACRSDQTCVTGTCTDDVPCDPACKTGESCIGGVCKCGSGPACSGTQRCCDGSCTNVSGSDVANCGACGRVCPATDSCCSGTCINTNVTPSHCGACGNACGDTADGCTSGSCTCGGGPRCPIFPCFFGMCVEG